MPGHVSLSLMPHLVLVNTSTVSWTHFCFHLLSNSKLCSAPVVSFPDALGANFEIRDTGTLSTGLSSTYQPVQNGDTNTF
jgi:hypothetical protein